MLKTVIYSTRLSPGAPRRAPSRPKAAAEREVRGVALRYVEDLSEARMQLGTVFSILF